MSSADLVILRFVPETVIGVTPATPAWQPLRYTGESLNFNIENTKTAEIRPDRTETDLIQTSGSGGGDLNFELSFDSFRDWISAVMCNNWVGTTTQTLQNGLLRKSYTVQKHFQDMATPQFHNYRGTCVESLSLSMEIGKIVEGSFGLMSFGLDPSTGVVDAQLAGSTFVAGTGSSPMNAVTNLQDFTIDGVAYSGCISSLKLMIKNNIRAIQCLGSLNPKNMKLGTIEVTGDLEFYFNEGTEYAKFVAGTEFDFSFALEDDANNRYNFILPRCKYESGEVVAGGRNTDVMLSAKWRALYDSTTGRVLQITSTATTGGGGGGGLLRPRFALGGATAGANPGTQAALFASMTQFGSSGTRTGNFSLTTIGGSYGWVAVLASACSTGVRFEEGAGTGAFGGWDGAASAGNFGGGPLDPSGSPTLNAPAFAITYTDPSGNVWRMFRQDFVNATPSATTFVIS